MNDPSNVVLGAAGGVAVILLVVALEWFRRRQQSRRVAYREYLLHRRDAVKLGDLDVDSRE